MDSMAPVMPEIFLPANDQLLRDLVADYFYGTDDAGVHRFSGARFETIGGRWDAEESRNIITPADLVAVTTLSVPVKGDAAVRLLERQAGEISDLLAQMPGVRTALWEVGDSVITSEDSPAVKLWRLLRSGRDGLGPTTTSKLMARKRAHLIPVYDTVVASALGLPSSSGHWNTMQELMQRTVDGQPLFKRLDNVAVDLGIADVVTPLRVFDVALWYHSNPRPRVRRWVTDMAAGASRRR